MSKITSPMTALKIAANITDANKALELHDIAAETGDTNLERALQTRAQQLGGSLKADKTATLAKRIHEQHTNLLTEYSTKAARYTEKLAAGQVNNDFIREETNYPRFAAEVEAAAGDATRNYEDAVHAYEAALTALATIGSSNDPATALLAETRTSKAWARIERLIAGSDNPYAPITKAVQAASTSADSITLAAILNEAPSYLASRGIDDAQETIEGIIREYNPDINATHQQMTTAAKLRDITTHNASVIRKATEPAPTHAPRNLNALAYYVDPTTVV